MKREEAIKYGTEWLKDEYLDAKDGAFITIALEALKQESILDKIKEEIQQLPITDTAIKLVTAVLDKYKTEVEVKK